MFAKSGFLQSWLYRDYSPIGIDVGADTVKMLQLCRRNGRWQVAASGLYSFGETVRSSPALRPGHTVDAIVSLLSGPAGPGFRGNRVVVALNHEQAIVKNARLPVMPPEELAEAVRWEAADRFPFDVSKAVVRHTVAGQVRQGGEMRQEVIMFAVSDQAVREQLRLLGEAGCQAVGLDAQPVALARAASFFMPAGGGDDVQTLADLGARSTQLIVLRGGQIVFVKTIEIGADDLTKAVAEKVGVGFDDAAAVRFRMGCGEDGGDGANDDVPVGQDATQAKVRQAVENAIRPVIERLGNEITLCLRYFSVSFRGQRPETVTAVGGASHDRLLCQLLAESLGAKVEVGHPLARCRPNEWTCQWGGGVEAGGPEWATALGCCLKPIEHKHRRPSPANRGEAAETAAGAK